MKPEDELALSFYRELSVIDERRGITLVEHMTKGRLYVKKTMSVFDREVFRILAEERFPQVPEIAEVIEDGDRLIVIEEYINGQSLEQRLESGPLTEEEVRRFVLQLCVVLQPLHEHEPKIIHRDIKPSNLILSGGQLWLIDFNAARLNWDEMIKGTNGSTGAHGEHPTGRGRDTVLMGTEEYAAPEQFGFARSSERTDIYAIGVVMNRLLTGRFPAEEIYDGGLGGVIRRCISIDPKDRYANVRELAVALRKARAAEGPRETGGRGQTAGTQMTGGQMTGEQTAGGRRTISGIGDIFREIPGFRSGRPVPMIFAGLGYLMVLATISITEITKSDGSPAGPTETMVNRVLMSLAIFGLIFYFGNFMGFRDVFPFKKREQMPPNIARVVLGALIILFVPVIVAVLIYP